MTAPEVIVVGGGAAGFFSAITCAEANPNARVSVLEQGPRFLSKVRISGGGRCNVTNVCSITRDFAARYPRGQQAMIGALARFSTTDTQDWFNARGVELKAEEDGRIFPTTDSSETIIACLTNAAQSAGVELIPNCGVTSAIRQPTNRFRIELSTGQYRECDRLLLATGGCRTPALAKLAEGLGHSISLPVPSLFTLNIESPWLAQLPGVSLSDAEVSAPDLKLRERGPILITHWGLSGPAVLRLSAWGARELHSVDYKFSVHVNWLPSRNRPQLEQEFQQRRQTEGARQVINSPIAPLSARLWEQLVFASGLPREKRWASLSREEFDRLARQLGDTVLPVHGKSLNKDEFVTCGGIKLSEINFKTMESRLCPGLHFAGELLDIDGVTGGFNFQAAWTTGWIAGHAMAGKN